VSSYESIRISLEGPGGVTTRVLEASVAEWVLAIVQALPDDVRARVYTDIERRMARDQVA
jgi:hypothetical protein